MASELHWSQQRTIYQDIARYGSFKRWSETMIDTKAINIRFYSDAFELQPTYGSPGAACFDLCANLGGLGREINFADGLLVHTGIYIEIPDGYAGFIFPRSGLACKENISIANCVGVIDSDYRGEIMVKLVDQSSVHKSHVIKHGQRIAQMLVLPVPKVNLIPITKSDLTETERGQNGFGSTGR